MVGCGGIGQALLRALALRTPHLELVGAARHDFRTNEPGSWEKVSYWNLDLTSDASLAQLGEKLSEGSELRLVINTAGLLHTGSMQPEKRLTQVTRPHLEMSFGINAFAPLLLAQAIESHLPRQEAFHFSSLSARVGSIGDNKLGGWYSYRAAKAAQNQLLRTLALEWQRRRPQGCVSLLHPGTTATGLSAPFQSSVSPDRLFTPARSAGQLLDVLEGLGPEKTGRFWAWDGQEIPW